MPRTARRAQLLDAALEVFVAQGYHSAAMDDIADRAGVSKPVLYQHFPGKLELYLALLDQTVDSVIEAAREALVSTEDNKERVTAAVQAFYAYVANEGGAFRLVFESDLVNEPQVRERHQTPDRDDTGHREQRAEREQQQPKPPHRIDRHNPAPERLPSPSRSARLAVTCSPQCTKAVAPTGG